MERYRIDVKTSQWKWLVTGCTWSLVVVSSVWADSPGGVWGQDYEAALKQAQTKHRLILASVTAVWCGPCQQMKQLTLNDRDVLQVAQERYVAVSIDGDRRSDLVSKLGVTAYPTTFVLNADGSVKQRWVGFQSASNFRRELERLAGPAISKPETMVAQASPSQERSATPSSLVVQPISATTPANTLPVDFSGFCLVSLLDENKLRRGDETFVAEHNGVRVCFYSAEHREKFVANPGRYWPVANGNCLVTSRETHQQLPGDPRVGVLWKNRLWFFANRERQRQFMESPNRFANGL